MTAIGHNQLEVARDGETVTLTVRCIDRYAAILLYEELIAGGLAGQIVIQIATINRETGGPHARP